MEVNRRWGLELGGEQEKEKKKKATLTTTHGSSPELPRGGERLILEIITFPLPASSGYSRASAAPTDPTDTPQARSGVGIPLAKGVTARPQQAPGAERRGARSRLPAHCVAVNEARAPISGRFASRGSAPPAHFPGTLTSRELSPAPSFGFERGTQGLQEGARRLLSSPTRGAGRGVACARAQHGPGRTTCARARAAPSIPSPPATPFSPTSNFTTPPPVSSLRSGGCEPRGAAGVVAATSLHNPASQLFTQPGL